MSIPLSPIWSARLLFNPSCGRGGSGPAVSAASLRLGWGEGLAVRVATGAAAPSELPLLWDFPYVFRAVPRAVDCRFCLASLCLRCPAATGVVWRRFPCAVSLVFRVFWSSASLHRRCRRCSFSWGCLLPFSEGNRHPRGGYAGALPLEPKLLYLVPFYSFP